MDQLNNLMDTIFGLFDNFLDTLFKSMANGPGDSINLKICIMVIAIICGINVVLAIIESKLDNLDLEDFDDDYNTYDDIEDFDKDYVSDRVSFSKKGTICYFNDYVKLKHDGIYVSNELSDIQDIELNENHNLVITHDGYEETIDSFKVSYVVYNFIRDTLLTKNIC